MRGKGEVESWRRQEKFQDARQVCPCGRRGKRKDVWKKESYQPLVLNLQASPLSEKPLPYKQRPGPKSIVVDLEDSSGTVHQLFSPQKIHMVYSQSPTTLCS
jgi:hypothetical protein